MFFSFAVPVYVTPVAGFSHIHKYFLFVLGKGETFPIH